MRTTLLLLLMATAYAVASDMDYRDAVLARTYCLEGCPTEQAILWTDPVAGLGYKAWADAVNTRLGTLANVKATWTPDPGKSHDRAMASR